MSKELTTQIKATTSATESINAIPIIYCSLNEVDQHNNSNNHNNNSNHNNNNNHNKSNNNNNNISSNLVVAATISSINSLNNYNHNNEPILNISNQNNVPSSEEFLEKFQQQEIINKPSLSTTLLKQTGEEKSSITIREEETNPTLKSTSTINRNIITITSKNNINTSLATKDFNDLTTKKYSKLLRSTKSASQLIDFEREFTNQAFQSQQYSFLKTSLFLKSIIQNYLKYSNNIQHNNHESGVFLDDIQMTRMSKPVNNSHQPKPTNIPVKKSLNVSTQQEENKIILSKNTDSIPKSTTPTDKTIILSSKNSYSNIENSIAETTNNGNNSPKNEQNKRSNMIRRSSSISSDPIAVSPSQQLNNTTVERPVFSKSLTNKIAIKTANARNNQTARHSRTNSLNQSYNLNFTTDTLILSNKPSPLIASSVRKNSNNLNKSLNVLNHSNMNSQSSSLLNQLSNKNNVSQVELNGNNVNNTISTTNNNNNKQSSNKYTKSTSNTKK